MSQLVKNITEPIARVKEYGSKRYIYCKGSQVEIHGATLPFPDWVFSIPYGIKFTIDGHTYPISAQHWEAEPQLGAGLAHIVNAAILLNYIRTSNLQQVGQLYQSQFLPLWIATHSLYIGSILYIIVTIVFNRYLDVIRAKFRRTPRVLEAQEESNKLAQLKEEL